MSGGENKLCFHTGAFISFIQNGEMRLISFDLGFVQKTGICVGQADLGLTVYLRMTLKS